MKAFDEPAAAALGDLALFSREVLRKPLYGYQLAAARAVMASVSAGRGMRFCW